MTAAGRLARPGYYYKYAYIPDIYAGFRCIIYIFFHKLQLAVAQFQTRVGRKQACNVILLDHGKGEHPKASHFGIQRYAIILNDIVKLCLAFGEINMT